MYISESGWGSVWGARWAMPSRMEGLTGRRDASPVGMPIRSNLHLWKCLGTPRIAHNIQRLPVYSEFGTYVHVKMIHGCSLSGVTIPNTMLPWSSIHWGYCQCGSHLHGQRLWSSRLRYTSTNSICHFLLSNTRHLTNDPVQQGQLFCVLYLTPQLAAQLASWMHSFLGQGHGSLRLEEAMLNVEADSYDGKAITSQVSWIAILIWLYGVPTYNTGMERVDTESPYQTCKGLPVITVPLISYTDDTSGNRIKVGSGTSLTIGQARTFVCIFFL